MTVVLYVAAALVATAATAFGVFVKRSTDLLKFLAGAFFVSGGLQLYLAAADVSIPLLGTDFTQTPSTGFVRAPVHLVLSALCCYFGFLRTNRRGPPGEDVNDGRP
jgi:hypothetical protein